MDSPLLTDLYQLTMGYAYWKHEMAETEAVFHLFYRRPPFGETAVLVAGVEPAVDYLAKLSFTDSEIAYLKTLKGADGESLFEQGYLDYLKTLDWRLDVMAIPEGNVAFPHEPLLRIQGPLIQCQLVETALLNMVNFQTLAATKAARICEAAEGDSVLEFGLRRAQGPDGGMSAARAAYIGGCDATSNVLAGMHYGIPVKGTHAHSWVMSFDEEQKAFDCYAEAMPNNAILLVDTFDTLEGVKKAIETGKKLQEKGHQLLGVRLDSGDLVKLSRGARQLLDEAGMSSAKVVASNDLDEYAIRDLKAKGACIDVWGIGTKLVTAYDQPALGGVYKLGAIRDAQGEWKYRVKLSEDLIKVSNPGILQVARIENEEGEIQGDIIYNEIDGLSEIPENHRVLLQKVIDQGQRVKEGEPIEIARERALKVWPNRPRGDQAIVCLDPKVEQTKRELLAQNGFPVQ